MTRLGPMEGSRACTGRRQCCCGSLAGDGRHSDLRRTDAQNMSLSVTEGQPFKLRERKS